MPCWLLSRVASRRSFPEVPQRSLCFPTHAIKLCMDGAPTTVRSQLCEKVFSIHSAFVTMGRESNCRFLGSHAVARNDSLRAIGVHRAQVELHGEVPARRPWCTRLRPGSNRASACAWVRWMLGVC